MNTRRSARAIASSDGSILILRKGASALLFFPAQVAAIKGGAGSAVVTSIPSVGTAAIETLLAGGATFVACNAQGPTVLVFRLPNALVVGCPLGAEKPAQATLQALGVELLLSEIAPTPGEVEAPITYVVSALEAAFFAKLL